jgi:hypothetical protein
MVKNNLRLSLLIFILISLIIVYPVFAEVKVFEQEVEEAVSRGQSQEQVEAFALQKAKRLAVEEAGTYISSLTVVQNYQLQKDEVTALASGIVQAKIVGIPSVVIKNGVIHVTVKAKITVDTAVLDQQIKEIMKENGTLKKLEDAQKNVRELENKLANLKSSEVKRLEELNTQVLALEQERDRQRLLREEQALKAKGELSRAEADRIAKEWEMQDRISRTLAEQEKAKREEAAKLLTLKKIGTDGRFIAYNDGTVMDTRTGLMWAAKDNGSDINWQGAKSYCENYREGGYTDWRMPTQDELAGLYDKAKSYKSACGDDAHLTELIRLTCYWTWASETRDSGAACFRFGGGGYRCWGPLSGSIFSRVLPVRSGK